MRRWTAGRSAGMWRGLIAFTFILGVHAALVTPTRGQTATPTTPPAVAESISPETQIETTRGEISAELERLETQIAAGAPGAERFRREAELLRRIDLALKQQLVTLNQTRESETSLQAIQEELDRWRESGPAESGPYSLLLLDSIRDELGTLEARAETVEAGVRAATQAREQARTAYEEREKERRQAREASESSSGEADGAEAARRLRFAVLESRLAARELDVRKLEVDRQHVLKRLHESRMALAREREQQIAADATLTQDDYRSRVVELEAKQDQVRRRQALQQSEIELAEREWVAAKGRLDAAGATADAALLEEVAARRLALQLRQRELAILTKRADRLAGMQATWKRRLQLWRGGEDRATIATWDAELRAMLERLDTEYRLQELELRDLSKERVTLQTRLDALEDVDPAAASWVRRQLQTTNEMGVVYEENVASIESARRLVVRTLDDIGGELATVTWAERWTGLRNSVVAIWRFEITSVDDRSITVGKIVIGVFLLFVGFFLSKLISGLLGRRLLPRFGLNEGASAAVRSIVFYLLLVTFVFISLRTVNVPLTAFTILGGAVAIGVGFGSQAIMNNFMSGLILLAERPIRVGDLIQLDSLYGVVQHIGARSTRLRTGDNVEIVVPNSAFLETNVINWTLSSNKVRIHVSVGVAYGSPVRDVARLLMRAAEEHGRVHQSPAPIVLFTEFGDNALAFEVHFWITMRKVMDRRILQSDIHHRIDTLFHEAGIVIAFPQRDVHLNTLSPLDVRVLAPDAS